MISRWLALFLILVIVILSGGCWSRKEIEKLAIVTATGFDKVDIDGQEKWRITSLIAKPGELRTGNGRGGGAGGRTPDMIISGTGDTLLDAGRNFSTRLPRTVFLASSGVILVGERLAREGVQQVLDFLTRDIRMRLRSWVLVTEGEALDALRASPEMEKLLSTEIVGMVATTNPLVGKAAAATLRDFTMELNDPGQDAVVSRLEIVTPTEETGAGGSVRGGEAPAGPAKTVRLRGAAAFRGEKLAGWMGDRDTRGYLLITGKLKGGVLPIQIHGGPKDTTIHIARSSSRITPAVQDGQISFLVEIKIEGDLGEHEGTENFGSLGKIKTVEKFFAQEIQSIAEGTIALAQGELQADILGLGEVLYRQNPVEWQKVKDQWREIFPGVSVEVSIQAKVRRTGMISDTPPAR